MADDLRFFLLMEKEGLMGVVMESMSGWETGHYHNK
jgi:hypothetical protein